jgi:LacI family transcriptional regulator
VALVIETSMASGRQILTGIARYSRECGPWAVYHEPGHMQKGLPDWLRHWQGDGIIARVRSDAVAEALASLTIPVVDVLDDFPHPQIAGVRVNNAGIAQMAMEHFLDRGFRHFAYCGIRGRRWARLREEACVELARAAGHRCDVYHLPRQGSPAWYAEAERERLAEFVRSLPIPSAILACNDLAGQRVLDACRRVHVAVPENVVVLGVDNDEALCEISDPVLSSVDPAYVQIGYHAAAVLDRMLQGEPPLEWEVLWQPAEVVVRQSTDILAIDDPDLAAAVRFIRDHACEPIGVADVVRHVGVSYSTLKRRFRDVFGRSIHDEIVRIRLERARELLTGTELPLSAIALRTGFKHQESLGAVFKAHFGVTPGQFRRDYGSDSAGP